MSTWSFVVNSTVPVSVTRLQIFASLVNPCLEIEINELRVAEVVPKPVVAQPLAFHIMKL